MADIHVNDIGVVFKLNVKDQDGNILNLHSAQTMQILLQDPNANTQVKTAVLTTDGTDGNMQYATLQGDLGVAGKWKLQGYVVVSGYQIHTDIVTFNVKANLN